MEGLKAAKRAAPCGGSPFFDRLCCLCAFCFPFGLLQCIVLTQCPFSDPDGWCLYSKFHKAHHEWMAHVNAELEPKGCYLKLFSRKNGDKEHCEMVIGLTKSESQSIKREPPVFHDLCPSGRGRAC